MGRVVEVGPSWGDYGYGSYEGVSDGRKGRKGA